jgi:uncharacterized membrane protein YhaH (DUF805 family)
MSPPPLFSFRGRIQRIDHVLSTVVVVDLLLLLQKSLHSLDLFALPVAVISIIILSWFGLAARIKRCHDLGHSGFFALIPLYGLLLIFMDGTPGENEYGPNPKDGPHAARDASGLPLAIAILIASLGFWLVIAVSR